MISNATRSIKLMALTLIIVPCIVVVDVFIYIAFIVCNAVQQLTLMHTGSKAQHILYIHITYYIVHITHPYYHPIIASEA